MKAITKALIKLNIIQTESQLNTVIESDYLHFKSLESVRRMELRWRNVERIQRWRLKMQELKMQNTPIPL